MATSTGIHVEAAKQQAQEEQTKEQKELEDLTKALWYLNRKIENLKQSYLAQFASYSVLDSVFEVSSPDANNDINVLHRDFDVGVQANVIRISLEDSPGAIKSVSPLPSTQLD